MANINFKLGFDLDKQGIEQAKSQLNQLKTMIKDSPDFALDKELQKAYKSAEALEKALKKTYNTKLDKVNITEFNNEIKKSKTSLGAIQKDLANVGVKGADAFHRIGYEINKVGLETKQSSKLLNEMFDTFGKTVKWGIASSAMNQMAGSIQRAVGFTKSLDESLNNIRVVSGKNKAEMSAFAKEANAAAQALGKTTTEYTDASLIFFQQGKTAEEVRSLTEATLMGANVTGTEVSEMANLLTAVMNGYNIEASRALEITDKLAAVGAATGSDFEELATGMSKVASMASVAGVEVDELNSMLATVTTVTREAPESIGTSFKTIFGRIAEVKAGKEDEEGWDLGKVEDTFKKVGMSVLDLEGNMKDVGDIIEEVGGKWSGFNRETQMALANAMAGQRQANRLIALFENWDMYMETVTVSQDSLGATMEQNAVREESLAYQTKQLTANLESLWANIFDESLLMTGVSLMNKVVDGANTFIDSVGGIGGALGVLGGIATFVFSKQIGGSIASVQGKLSSFVDDLQKTKDAKGRMTAQTTLEREVDEESGGQPSLARQYELTQHQKAMEMADNELKIKKYLTDEEHKKYKALTEVVNKESEALTKAQKRLAVAKDIVAETGLEGEQLTKANLKDVKGTATKEKEELLEIERITESMKTKDNQRVVSKDALLAKLQQEGIKNLDIIKHIEASKKGNIQLDAIHEQINFELNERIDRLETINALEQEGFANVEAEAEALENNRDRSVQAAEEELDRMTQQAEKQEKLQKRMAVGAAAVTAAFGVGGAIKEYTEAAGDMEKQNDAIVSGMNSLGASLMMLPGPWGKVAGAVTMAIGQAIKWTRENTGMGKVMKDNAKDLEDYKNKMAELTNAQKNLTAATNKMKGLEALEEGGLTNDELEEYKTLTKEIAEMAPEVVDYYDAYGNAVLKTRSEIDKLNESIDNQIKKQNENMSNKAASFTTEMAYLTTTGLAEKEKIQAEIDKLTSEIDTMYLEGKSQKSIDKKSDKLDELYVQMSDIQSRFDELGQSAQDSIITPFIGANDIFKELGEDFQGFTTSLFNVQDLQKGLDDLAKEGIDNTGALKKASEDYIETFKNGVLEVAGAFKIIQDSQNETMIKLEKKLAELPEATKQGIGDIALEMTPFMNEQELTTSIDKMAGYINEKGEIDAFGMMDYFRQVGETAKESIAQGIADATKGLNDTMNQDFGWGKTASSQLQEEIMNAISIGDEERVTILNALSEYQRGNTEVLETLYTTDAEIKGIIDKQVDDLISPEWSSAAEEAAGAALRDALDKMYEQKMAQDAVNESFGDTNILVDNYAAKMAQTLEGQEYIVDMWNEMVSITEEVGEGGLFSVDLIELDAQREELEALGESAKDAGLDMESLAKHATNIGEAFQDVLDNKELSNTFQKLNGMSDEAMENIRKLAQAAKEGNVDAAKSLQSEMGKVYATMYAQDETYFRHFVQNNRARLDDVALVTGIEADQHLSLASYQAELQGWVTQVGGQEHAKQLIDLQSYLGEQVAQAQSAAGTNAENQAAASDAANRAAAIMALATAGRMAESAKQAGASATEAGKVFLDTLASADTGAQAALEGLKGKLTDKGEKFESIVSFIDAAIAELSQGGEVKLDMSGFKEYKAPPVNYKPPSGSIAAPSAPSKPSTTTPGTSGPKPSTGGDDKGKDKEEKEVEDLEWEEDIYHDINIQLEQKQQLLDKLQKQQDKLYGKELLDNLAQQKKALQDQQKLLEKKLEMQKKDLDQQKQALSKQGVTFNVDGTISNYNQLLKEKLAYVNSLSGEAKEAAKEEFQSLVDMMEAYEDLMMNAINDTETAIQDAIDAQREIFLQEFDYKINVQLELTGQFEEAMDFQKEFFDSFEDSAENFQRTMDQLGNKMGEIQAIQDQIANVQSADLTDKERFERLDELSKQLKESTLDAKKLNEELTKIYTDTLKEGLDIVKEHSDEYKRMGDEVKHLQQMMKLLGQGENYEMLDAMFETQYKTLQGQIDVLSKQKNTLEAQRAALEAAGLKGTDEWKALNSAINDTQKELDKLAQDTLKVLQDEFRNSVDSILDDMDRVLSGGLGLDNLKKDYDELKEARKEYLDIEEKITEVGKLQSKINKDMAGITDPKKLETLQKFKDKELAALKEKDKLTKYDIDRANLMYDITLKQMALEEQKNAKNMMRLVRDAAGNWVYEFVEDNEAVIQAREDLSDALEKLQELDKKQFEKAQEDMIKAKLDYEKEINDIIKRQMNGEYATEEEFRNALQAATDKFNEEMKEKSEALNQAQQNGTMSSLATILLAYQQNSEGLGMLAGEQEEMMKNLATVIGTDFTMLGELLEALNSGNEEDFNAMAEQMGLDAETLKGTLESITGEIKEDWGGNITDMIGNIEGLETDSNNAVDEIMKKWEEYQTKVDETTKNTGNDLESIKDRIENIDTATGNLNTETDNLIQKFGEEMNQITALAKANDSLRKSYEDITKEVAKQIGELDKLIQKQKEAATGVNKPSGGSGGSSSGSGSGGSSGGSSSGGSSSGGSNNGSGGTPSYSANEAVTVKSNTTYWSNSKGQGPNGTAKAGTKYLIDDPARYKPMSGASHEVHISNSSGGDLGWVKKSELKKFNTGGYTGSFSSDVVDGKLAILHEKELVLNKEDTRNMLEAVKTLRGTGKANLGNIIAGVIEKSTSAMVSAIDRLGSKMGVSASQVGSASPQSQDINQSVSINADFSGVKSAGEIEKAFDSLAIQASQYASKRR